MAVEPIVQLSGKYKEELAATFDGLRQRSSVSVAAAQEHIQYLQQQAEQLKQADAQQVVGVFQDFSPVEVPTAKVLDTFAWLTVLQFTFGVFSAFSSVFLAPIFSFFIEPFSAALVSYVLLPVFLYRTVMATESEQEQRFYLLTSAATQGALTGFVLANRYLPALPPVAFLTPALIALVAQFGEGKFGSRQAFLGATLGAGLAAHLVFGFLFGLSSFPYFVLSLSYAAAGFATLQLQLKENGPNVKYQFIFYTATLLLHGVVFYLFGVPADQVPASSN